MGVNYSGDAGRSPSGRRRRLPQAVPAVPAVLSGGITKREKRNMYVRIVRFEGAEENWDERIEEVGNRIRGGGEGSPMAEVRGAVKRAMMLVDRENGRGAGVIFCESEEDLRRVEEAMPACRRGDTGVCRDVRGRGHIKGARSIPIDELEERLAELPADREVVAYCRGPFCAYAHDAVRRLQAAGHEARRLQDGWPEWQLAEKSTKRHRAA
jgi:hypothetical protein